MSTLNRNKVELCGRLTADVELKQTTNGKSVVSFYLAVNRPRPKDGGEQKADFVGCIAWEKTAELIARYFKKGDAIFIDGKIQTRNYKSRDGKTVYITEVRVDEVHFVDSKAPTTETAGFEEVADDEQLPV